MAASLRDVVTGNQFVGDLFRIAAVQGNFRQPSGVSHVHVEHPVAIRGAGGNLLGLAAGELLKVSPAGIHTPDVDGSFSVGKKAGKNDVAAIGAGVGTIDERAGFSGYGGLARCLRVDDAETGLAVSEEFPIRGPADRVMRSARTDLAKLAAACAARHHVEVESCFAQNRSQVTAIGGKARFGVIIGIASDGARFAIRIRDKNDLAVLELRQAQQAAPIWQPDRALDEVVVPGGKQTPLGSGHVDRDHAAEGIPGLKRPTDDGLAVG